MKKLLLKQKQNHSVVFSNNKTNPINYLNPFAFVAPSYVEQRMNQPNDVEVKVTFARLKTFFLSPYGVLGFTFFTLIVLCGLIIPFTTKSPYTISADDAFLDFGLRGFILGTDRLGRDIWARTWWGLRNSIGIATAATLADVLLGVVLGILMGYYRFFDRIFNFFIKVLNSVPNIIILILISIILSANVGSIILGIVLTGWIGMAQAVRGIVLQVSNQNFITSSKLLDTPNRSIMMGFIPFLLPTMFSILILNVPTALLADSGLAFLGIVVPNLPTLGSTFNAAISVITIYPQQLLGPVFILTFIIFNIRMISIGFSDAFRSNR
ncbi:Oligopeptide ACBC transport permease protein OppC [[Mycoplasma] cavipharyngis]|uniref:ABC transporter permease n=1 Tax=[Mycoplasma] cavipharyngis TaxID=92757 RepID=UPI0037042BE3